MSKEPQMPQEPISKVNDKVQAAKDTTKKVTNATINKADELYNKLPLDKINEKLAKLPYKLDAKSRGFKIGVAICAALIVLIGLKIVFGGKSKEKQVQQELQAKLVQQGDELAQQENAKSFQDFVAEMNKPIVIESATENWEKEKKRMEEERKKSEEESNKMLEADRARAKQKEEQSKLEEEKRKQELQEEKLAKEAQEQKVKQQRQQEAEERLKAKRAPRKKFLENYNRLVSQLAAQEHSTSDKALPLQLGEVKPYHHPIIKLVETPQSKISNILNEHLYEAEDLDTVTLHDKLFYLKNEYGLRTNTLYTGYFFLGQDESVEVLGGPSLTYMKNGVVTGMRIFFDHRMKYVWHIEQDNENESCVEYFKDDGSRDKTLLNIKREGETHEAGYKYINGKVMLDVAQSKNKNKTTYANEATERIETPEKKIKYWYKDGIISKKFEEYVATINNRKYKKEDHYIYDKDGVLESFTDKLYVGGSWDIFSQITYYPNGNMKTRDTYKKLEEFDQNGNRVKETHVGTNNYINPNEL